MYPGQSPQAMGMSEMGPQAGGAPPKHLMTMLATLMLNKRLQQTGQRPQMPGAPMNPGAVNGGSGGNRMAELARMQLSMGAPRRPMGY